MDIYIHTIPHHTTPTNNIAKRLNNFWMCDKLMCIMNYLFNNLCTTNFNYSILFINYFNVVTFALVKLPITHEHEFCAVLLFYYFIKKKNCTCFIDLNSNNFIYLNYSPIKKNTNNKNNIHVCRST